MTFYNQHKYMLPLCTTVYIQCCNCIDMLAYFTIVFMLPVEKINILLCLTWSQGRSCWWTSTSLQIRSSSQPWSPMRSVIRSFWWISTSGLSKNAHNIGQIQNRRQHRSLPFPQLKIFLYRITLATNSSGVRGGGGAKVRAWANQHIKLSQPENCTPPDPYTSYRGT